MVDPITVGSLVAGALGMAAEAALKGTVGEAVKDGYKALKEKVSHWGPGEVAALEATPSSNGRQAVVAEIIDAQSEDDRNALRVLAEALVIKLKENAPAIGLDVGRLTALEVELGDIAVTKGIGARIEDARVGTFKTGDISVGDRSGK
ncbi:MAG: hypothetical protein WA733_16160 [Methylocystis sp.]